MESYLNKESRQSLNKIIEFIKTSPEYIKCNELKARMKEDEKLLELITKVKELQKKYIRNNYNQKIKEELDYHIGLLNNNNLYVLYNHYLEKVNDQIDLVKNELNDYFVKITNNIL